MSIRKTEWRGGPPYNGDGFRLVDQTAPRGKALAPVPPDGELNEPVKRGKRRLPAPVFRTEYNRIYKGRRQTGRFWLFPDGREGEVVLGRAAYMTGEGRSGGGVYARERGGLGGGSICPGKGRSRRRRICPGKGRSGGGAYARERGISAEAAFCKALLTKTFPLGRRM